ncbi:MAG: alpha/beta hydrolase fold domain-containing protein, partial [Gemmatimonadota bacterium]
MQTFTYKIAGALAIQADVHGAGAGRRRRVVLAIHGGALIMGHREWVDGRLLGQLLDAGYAVVSIDYRLAPETRLAVLIED